MVKTVLQKPVLQYCRIKFFKLRYLRYSSAIFLSAILQCCITVFLECNTVLARDLGTHEVIYSIEEQDPIVLIQQKLKVMEKTGELGRRNHELQKKTRISVERPKSVEGITKAAKSRIFYYNPTYEVKEDLYGHQGHCYAKKGTRINPLETVNLPSDLVFFDGDDEEHLEWVKGQLNKAAEKKTPRLILVNGTPLKLAEKIGITVYFDQGGILTKKLGITHVPSVVSQEKLRLKIEEIVLPPSRESNAEGAR